MKSLGGEVVKKAMWLYPKVSGFNPSERWGHSACCYNGVVYIFGGCCGGLHFSDVLTLNLDTMTWNTLVTTGQRPGARDSHSSVLVGHKMIVMGGTNGSKKVNDLHILDLRTKEWSSPTCEGTPPSPRESHTATLVGDDKLVIFGGSGEGDANYLNDLHVLDLNIMKWTSPGGFGDLPVPRDSHIAVALGNKLLLYGGDCGDRYLGEVDVLDMGTLTWSRLAVQGSLPGVRAGHAAVTIGTRVFIIGGVGDKLYYSDIWILDITTCSWTQLSIRGQHPQGRFSHTAVVTDSDVTIYGGCGEDERPLNELLILQLGDQHPNGRYNISMCKIFGKHWSQEKRKSPQGTCTNLDVNQALPRNSDNFHLKKRRNNGSKVWELESEQEEHSLSLSQNSSPSQSDHEQTPMQKHSASVTETAIASYPFPMMKEKNQMQRNHKLDPRNSIQKTPQESHFMGEEHPRQLKPDQFLCVNPGRQEVQFLSSEHKPIETRLNHTLIGAEIQGKVDGAFDSGYLMTANVNGRILRGVLFTPGPGVMSRTTFLPQSPSLVVNSPVSVAQQYSTAHPISPTYVRSSQRPETLTNPEPPIQRFVKSHAVKTTPSFSRASGNRNDLHDVTLTLGGPAGGYGEL